MILILGASGRIGGFLFREFKKEGVEVTGTYSNNPQEGLIRFDLDNDKIENIHLDINHAIITAASNPRPELSKNWQDSYRTNVDKTIDFIKDCFRKKILPVYFSTDNVFDGEKGNYNEEDKTNPLNNYGRMKCKVEDFLISSKQPYLLLRMGKVFGIKNDNTLILETLQGLKEGKELKCSSDQIFTPIYAKDLFDFIHLALSKGLSGIFHLGSTVPLSRLDAAEKIRDFFSIKNSNIIPCKINEIGLSEKRPLKIDLNIEKYKKMTGKQEKPLAYYLNLVDEKELFFKDV